MSVGICFPFFGEKSNFLVLINLKNDSKASGSPKAICSYLEFNGEYNGNIKVEKMYENTREIFKFFVNVHVQVFLKKSK